MHVEKNDNVVLCTLLPILKLHSVIKVISVPILYKLHLIVIKEHFQMNESSFNSVLYRNNEKDPPLNPSNPNPGQLEKN